MLMDDRELQQIQDRLLLFINQGNTGALRQEDLALLLADYIEARQMVDYLVALNRHVLVHGGRHW